MRKTLTLAVPIAVIFAVVACTASTAKEEEQEKPADHGFFALTDIKWTDGPDSIPAGAKVAVLEGDVAKPGPLTMRLWLPDGWRIGAHWHPVAERVTVISGTLHFGVGDEFDKTKAKAMPAGAFGFVAAKMNHFLWAEGETVFQLDWEGPFEITYVNPADDPRMAKKSE